jgi:hypothetical protein
MWDIVGIVDSMFSYITIIIVSNIFYATVSSTLCWDHHSKRDGWWQRIWCSWQWGTSDVTDAFWRISIGDIVGEWWWHYLFVDGDLRGWIEGMVMNSFLHSYSHYYWRWFYLDGVATLGVDIGGIDHVIGGSDYWEEMWEAIVIPRFVTIILWFLFITSRLSEYGSILKSSQFVQNKITLFGWREGEWK